ncbi:MAG: type IV pilin protein [Pseudomonadota bacterium]
MPSAIARRPARRVMRGITLLELMIVVVIVGIMSSLAYPQYLNYRDRANRTEAKSALLNLVIDQERFYLNASTFTNDLTDLGYSAATDWPTRSGTYLVNVTAADASNFTATATYQGTGAEKDRCLTFTITADGAETSAPDTNCWTRTR